MDTKDHIIKQHKKNMFYVKFFIFFLFSANVVLHYHACSLENIKQIFKVYSPCARHLYRATRPVSKD